MNEVSRNFFRADERNFRDLRKTPTKTRYRPIARFLFGVFLGCSSRQGAMAGGALCLPPCPLRLPLLFPKNLASLRFSGALFIFQGTLIIKRAQPSPFLQNKSAHRADARFSVCQKFIPRTGKRRHLCGGSCRKCFPIARAGPLPARRWSGCICIRRGQSTRWRPRIPPAHKI